MIETLFFLGSVCSLSGSFNMHQSGFVSYDCKNESSRHQLKYFIFTALTVLWLSLHIIYVSPLCHSLIKHTGKTSPLGNYMQGTELEMQQPHIRLRSDPPGFCNSISITRGHFYRLPTPTTGPWPHKAACPPPQWQPHPCQQWSTA